MTATDELRRMLDERGVEWKCYGYENHTWWGEWHAENRASVNGLFLKVEAVITPEQAIEATLGRGTCEVEKSWHGESEMVEYHCIACDEYMSVEVVKPDGEQPPNFCPNCGRRVMAGDAE